MWLMVFRTIVSGFNPCALNPTLFLKEGFEIGFSTFGQKEISYFGLFEGRNRRAFLATKALFGFVST